MTVRTRPCPDLVDAVAAIRRGTLGPDVVLLPGLAVSRYLRPAQGMLSAWARVHLLEYAGTGRARDVRCTPSLADDVAAVRGWLDRHVPGRFLLVGHSYGSQVACRVAAAEGDRVRALVLASPTVDPAFRSPARLIAHWLRDKRHEPSRLGSIEAAEHRRARWPRKVAMLASLLADDPERWLAESRVPVTVVRGERDALSTLRWAQRLTERPDARLVRVPDGPHTFPLGQPEALAAAVRATYERVEDGCRT